MHRAALARPALVLLATVATVLGLCVGGAAAATPFEVTLGTPDASHAGSVTVEVATDAGYVIASLGDDPYDYDEPRQTFPATDEMATVDLPTWGRQGEVRLSVTPCTYSDATGERCNDPVSTVFTPTDLAPTVTWSEATRVGTSTPPYTVQVSDPEGDGSRLVVQYPAGGQENLARTGSTDLQLHRDFAGPMSVWRCAVDSFSLCADTGVRSPDVTVDRQLEVGITSSTEGPLSPHPDATPDVVVALTPDAQADYLLDWSVDRSTIGAEDVAVSGGPGAPIEMPVDLSGAPDGKRLLTFTLSRDIEGFGPVTATVSTTVSVDATAPAAVVEPEFTTFYPVQDGYRNRVRVVLSRGDGLREPETSATLEVIAADGTVIWRQNARGSGGLSVYWNGTTVAGDLAPEGRYTLRSTATDRVGNSSGATGSVMVSHKREVRKRFDKTIPARRVLVDTSVGPCSSISRSPRGSGSLGLYTNVKCDRGVSKSMVVTAYTLRLPPSVEDRNLILSVVGGAARSMPGSRAFLDVRRAGGAWQTHDTLLAERFGAHGAGAQKAGLVLTSDRDLVWVVYTGAGARYDVTSFRVVLSYKALVY
jgi:hypothetical protein